MKDRKDSTHRTIRFTTHRHLIFVDVTLDDSVTVLMILDYCASYTSVSRSLARQLGLDLKEDKRQRVATMSIGDIVTSKNVPAVVANLSQFKKSFRGTRFEGIVGASFLYRYKLRSITKEKESMSTTGRPAGGLTVGTRKSGFAQTRSEASTAIKAS